MIRMEYTGKIPDLQGKTALVRPPVNSPVFDPEKHVLAQFDDMDLKFNDRRMGYGWFPFMKSDFTPIGPKPVF